MKNCLRCVLNIIIPAIGLVLLVTLVPKLIVFFFPFVAGYLIAAMANPISVYLQRKLKIKRKHSSILIMVAVLALVVMMLYFILMGLYRLGVSFLNDLPGYIQAFMETINNMFSSHSVIIERLPEDVASVILSLKDNLNMYITEVMGSVVTPTAAAAGNAVKLIPSIFIYALITILSAFAFMIEWESVQAFLKRRLPKPLQDYIVFLKNDMKTIISGWLAAQFKIMFVVFAVLFAGFLFLKIKYGIWIAALTAFLDFLPALGVGFILWPWIAVELISGNFFTALCLSAIYVGTQAVRQILQPKIMGDSMGLPPLWTLLFLYLGFKFYGLVGMIFSVPVGMLFLSIYRYGFFDRVFSSIGELFELVAGFMDGGRKDNSEKQDKTEL